MKTVHAICTPTQFFQNLASATERYSDQRFFTFLDGKLVSVIAEPNFRIWPRSKGCSPVVVGRVDSSVNGITVHWHSRLPLPIILVYSAMGLFALVAFPLEASMFVLAAISILVAMFSFFGRTNQAKIERLIHEAAGAEPLEK